MKWTKPLYNIVKKMYKDHTWKEIADYLQSKHQFFKSPNAVKKAYQRYTKNPSLLTEKDGPKVLLFDIETAPMRGFVWRMWNNDLGLNQIETDWYVLSWSAKWLGDSEDKIMYMDQRNAKDIEDDKAILKGIWDLLDEADIVIGQNSKQFDHKKLNARFIINEMQPPSSYRHIDTKILAKRHFSFTSNRLEYMTDKLCKKYKKLKHGKFPGFSMWDQCMKGNKEAFKEMEEYNKYDVLSLEELYYRLIPWDNSINFNVYSNSVETICTCGSKKWIDNGYYYTNTGKFKRYRCKKCGSEVRSRDNELNRTLKKKTLKSGTSR